MQRLSKHLISMGTAVLLLALSPTSAGALQGVTSLVSNRTSNLTGFEKTRECAATKKRLAVAFLVDESSSIRSSDSGNKRTRAVSRAISKLSLNLIAVSGANQPKIDVLISVFGSSFTSLGPKTGERENGNWFSLEDELVELNEQVAALATRNTAVDTDYQIGLEGIEIEFAEYIRRNGDTCKVLVWLSDGKMDLDNNGGTDTDEKKSYGDICEKSGVAPRLRNMEIFIFGLGLSGAASGQQGDFSRMTQIVEGRSDCGPLGPSGGDSAVGYFVPVASADQLESAFDKIFPPPPPPQPPCEGQGADPLCSEFRIEVKSPAQKARLLVSALGEISEIRVLRPDKSEVRIFDESGFLTSAAVDISIDASSTTARIELDVSKNKGTWSLQVIGVDSAEARVSLFSLVKPAVTGLPISLLRDTPAKIAVSVVDRDLEGITVLRKGAVSQGAPGLAYSLSANAKFGSLSVPASVTQTTSGVFEVALGGNLTNASAQGSLFLSAIANVGEFTVPLGDLQVPIALSWGDSFPTVKSVVVTQINSGDNDRKFSTVTFEVVGPKDGTGVVRATSSLRVVERPPSLGEVVPEVRLGERAEVSVAAGGEQKLILEVDPKGEANGILTIELTVELESRDGEIKTDQVLVSIQMSRPFGLIDFFKLFVIMTSLFVAIQGAVIWPATRYVARIRGLPVSTRVVTGDIVINNVDIVAGAEKSLETMVAEHRNLGTSTKSGLTQSIRGFTLRGFPSIIYKGLFRPRRVLVYVKRDTKNETELTFGQAGIEVVKSTRWGLVNPNLNGVWAVSFLESDARLIQANPSRELKGYLLYLLPEGPLGDTSPFAQKLKADLELKRFRSLIPKLFDERHSDAGSRGGKKAKAGEGDLIGERAKPASEGQSSQRKSAPKDRKRDLYN